VLGDTRGETSIKHANVAVVFLPENIPIEVVCYNPAYTEPYAILNNIGKEFLSSLGETIYQGWMQYTRELLALDGERLDQAKIVGMILQDAETLHDHALTSFAVAENAALSNDYTTMAEGLSRVWISEREAYVKIKRDIMDATSVVIYFAVLLVPFSVSMNMAIS